MQRVRVQAFVAAPFCSVTLDRWKTRLVDIPKPLRICFLTRQLNEGGAERQLLELAKGLDKSQFEATILTFYQGGGLSGEAKSIPGVRFIELEKTSRWQVARFFIRLLFALRKLRPKVLHGYLGVSNLLCVFLKLFLPGTRIVWGVRSSNMDLSRYDWLARLTFRMERKLARFADLIICNSEAGRNYYTAQGFPEGKTVVIPNGIDCERFTPDANVRQRIREEWRIGEDEILIGSVARLDPMKDHATFLAAAAKLSQTCKKARFICVGDGPTQYRQTLQNLTRQLGLESRVLWTGKRNDMPHVYNALDLLISSSSFGEGFSNTIAEAMACGVPCVVTRVGDSAEVVGETGLAVPPRDPEALANACLKLLGKDEDHRQRMGEQARACIVSRFSRDRLVQSTASALKSLVV